MLSKIGVSMFAQILGIMAVIVGVLGGLAWGPSTIREQQAVDEGKE